jgi:hypothetical protein
MTAKLTPEDIQILEKNNINIEKDIPIFLQEMKAYLATVWDKKYIDELDISSVETFNKSFNYPSWGGYHIIDDAFTGPNIDIDILSKKSKELVGFFYGIHFH